MTFSYTFNKSSGHADITEGSTFVPERTFGSAFDLRSVYLPDTIEVIETNAFKFSGLEVVSLPDSLTRIERGAFAYTDLNRVTIPD